MLRKLKVTTLSLVFLLHAFGVLHAHSLNTLPDDSESESVQPFQDSLSGGKIQTSKSATSTRKPKTRKTNKNQGKRTAAQAQTAKRPAPKARKTEKSRRETARQKSPQPSTSKKATAFEMDYEKRAGKPLVVTSRGRTAATQARAIHRITKTNGVRYVTRLYRNRRAIREILVPYKLHRRRPRKAEREMARVIQSQIDRGIYVSNHLRGLAIDVRSRGRGAARLSILRQVARSLGGRVSIERDHYHVELS